MHQPTLSTADPGFAPPCWPSSFSWRQDRLRQSRQRARRCCGKRPRGRGRGVWRRLRRPSGGGGCLRRAPSRRRRAWPDLGCSVCRDPVVDRRLPLGRAAFLASELRLDIGVLGPGVPCVVRDPVRLLHVACRLPPTPCPSRPIVARSTRWDDSPGQTHTRLAPRARGGTLEPRIQEPALRLKA